MFSRSLKLRFLLDAEAAGFLNNCPKLTAVVAKVSKKSDLSFEDMGFFKNPLDRNAGSLLKRACDAPVAAFHPTVARTCVARNLVAWCEQLGEHLEAQGPGKEVLEFLSLITKAATYVAKASWKRLG